MRFGVSVGRIGTLGARAPYAGSVLIGAMIFLVAAMVASSGFNQRVGSVPDEPMARAKSAVCLTRPAPRARAAGLVHDAPGLSPLGAKGWIARVVRDSRAFAGSDSASCGLLDTGSDVRAVQKNDPPHVRRAIHLHSRSRGVSVMGSRGRTRSGRRGNRRCRRPGRDPSRRRRGRRRRRGSGRRGSRRCRRRGRGRSRRRTDTRPRA